MLVNSPISVKVRLQSRKSKSIVEAELVAKALTTKEAMFSSDIMVKLRQEVLFRAGACGEGQDRHPLHYNQFAHLDNMNLGRYHRCTLIKLIKDLNNKCGSPALLLLLPNSPRLIVPNFFKGRFFAVALSLYLVFLRMVRRIYLFWYRTLVFARIITKERPSSNHVIWYAIAYTGHDLSQTREYLLILCQTKKETSGEERRNRQEETKKGKQVSSQIQKPWVKYHNNLWNPLNKN